MADKYGVEVVPTLLFFENGAISKRLEGVIRRASLVDWLSGREILVTQVFFPWLPLFEHCWIFICHSCIIPSRPAEEYSAA
ncbi:MAG: thioredoxin family protein [Proteobacteria bacterium]|nr:thioredoxin family protein [Pseudomonadota bacterium]MBU4074047.1 thioredoxin family protein [Pseudomonadota bacterium]MBU4121979.1 thioredoxin family protein [Pseudomonadota bacterium]